MLMFSLLQIVDYNVQGGKMNRGIALVESYALLENQKVSEGNMEIAIALGWAVELVIIFIYIFTSHVFNFYV